MLKRIAIVTDIYDARSWEVIECENVVDIIREKYPEFPQNARIYNNFISLEHDITPLTIEDCDNLNNKTDNFIMVIYPAGFVAAWGFFEWAVAALFVVTVAAAILLRPKIPAIGDNAFNDQSANNSLSNRSNQARLNGRIPDIYGQVRSIPDLISTPLKFFLSNGEYEYSQFCIGRGDYEFSILPSTKYDIRDGDTLIEEIPDTTLLIWGPNKCFNNASIESATVKIRPVVPVLIDSLRHATVMRSNSVDGTITTPLNSDDYEMHASPVTPFGIQCNADGTILFENGVPIDYTQHYNVGDIVTFTLVVSSLFTGGEGLYFKGSCELLFVEAKKLVLKEPLVNISNWQYIVDNGSIYLTDVFTRKENLDNYQGPFFIDIPCDKLLLNFVANGLYLDNGDVFYPFDILIEIEIQQATETGSPVGLPVITQHTIEGSKKNDKFIGKTILIDNPVQNSRCKIRIRRITPTPTNFQGSVADELKWRDLYAIKLHNQPSLPQYVAHFGDVTTGVMISKANSQALALKERKLNCVVTRKIRKRLSGSIFSTTLHATKRADEIICAVSLDPKIGNRGLNELDIDNIYSKIAEVQTYFGHEKCIEFCHTFDKTDTSYEETLTAIANTAFCTAHRLGNKIQLYFEKEEWIATILFNHRNVLPGTETRTYNFQNSGNNDGIELEWIDLKNVDLPTTKYMPADRSAINPMKLSPVGIRNGLQAYFHLMREYNKLRYQKFVTEFKSTQEGFICAVGNKILVADSTRPNIQAGDVTAIDNLIVTLSQIVNLQGGANWILFVQLHDGTVDAIPVTAGPQGDQLILNRPPVTPFTIFDGMYSKPTYMLVSEQNNDIREFIVKEKSYDSISTCGITAINYDQRYYEKDMAYRNGDVDENGIGFSIAIVCPSNGEKRPPKATYQAVVLNGPEDGNYVFTWIFPLLRFKFGQTVEHETVITGVIEVQLVVIETNSGAQRTATITNYIENGSPVLDFIILLPVALSGHERLSTVPYRCVAIPDLPTGAVTWYFDDNTTLTGYETEKTWLTTGLKFAIAVVRDSVTGFSWHEVIAINVIEPVNPQFTVEIVSPVGNSNYNAGDAVTYNCNVTAQLPDSDLEYLWIFDDNTVLAGKTVQKSWNVEGARVVNLQVYDRANNVYANSSVTINVFMLTTLVNFEFQKEPYFNNALIYNLKCPVCGTIDDNSMIICGGYKETYPFAHGMEVFNLSVNLKKCYKFNGEGFYPIADMNYARSQMRVEYVVNNGGNVQLLWTLPNSVNANTIIGSGSFTMSAIDRMEPYETYDTVNNVWIKGNTNINVSDRGHPYRWGNYCFTPSGFSIIRDSNDVPELITFSITGDEKVTININSHVNRSYLTPSCTEIGPGRMEYTLMYEPYYRIQNLNGSHTKLLYLRQIMIQSYTPDEFFMTGEPSLSEDQLRWDGNWFLEKYPYSELPGESTPAGLEEEIPTLTLLENEYKGVLQPSSSSASNADYDCLLCGMYLYVRHNGQWVTKNMRNELFPTGEMFYFNQAYVRMCIIGNYLYFLRSNQSFPDIIYKFNLTSMLVEASLIIQGLNNVKPYLKLYKLNERFLVILAGNDTVIYDTESMVTVRSLLNYGPPAWIDAECNGKIYRLSNTPDQLSLIIALQ